MSSDTSASFDEGEPASREDNEALIVSPQKRPSPDESLQNELSSLRK
jgi:hypothetical protein